MKVTAQSPSKRNESPSARSSPQSGNTSSSIAQASPLDLRAPVANRRAPLVPTSAFTSALRLSGIAYLMCSFWALVLYQRPTSTWSGYETKYSRR